MQYEDFDDDQDYEPQGSDLLKQLRKQLREAQKEATALREENEKLQVGVRQRTLAEALPEGVKPGIVKWAVKDGVTNPDELKAWLEENGEFFGAPAPAADEEAVSEDDLRQMQAVQRQTATGTVQTASRQQAALKYLNDAQTPEEWLTRTKEINSGQFTG